MQPTIEYMILIPVLILQIFLFPIMVGAVMGQWTTDRQALELQQTASSLSGIIEQTYLSLNHTSILSCTFNSTLNFPATIEGFNYTAKATLQAVSDTTYGSSQVLTLTLTLKGTQISTTVSATLGQNVQWENSVFASNPPTNCLIAQKLPTQTIQLSFGS
jgi:hypothetical protein